MAPNDPPMAARAFSLLVYEVSRLLRRNFNRHVRHAGLGVTRLQASVIIEIGRNEGISQAAVAAVLDIEPIALVRMLDRLHEEGLVERRAHPTDRRMHTLWLTPAARPVLDQIVAINRAISAEAFAGLPASLHTAMMAALDDIKGNLGAPADAAPDPDAEPTRAGKRAAS